MSEPCRHCHGSRFVRNPAWNGYRPCDEIPDDADRYPQIHAERLDFEAKHGPELQPCPHCRPRPTSTRPKQPRPAGKQRRRANRLAPLPLRLWSPKK